MATESRPGKHFQKSPKLARQWGAPYVRPPEEVHHVIMLPIPFVWTKYKDIQSKLQYDKLELIWILDD